LLEEMYLSPDFDNRYFVERLAREGNPTALVVLSRIILSPAVLNYQRQNALEELVSIAVGFDEKVRPAARDVLPTETKGEEPGAGRLTSLVIDQLVREMKK